MHLLLIFLLAGNEQSRPRCVFLNQAHHCISPAISSKWKCCKRLHLFPLILLHTCSQRRPGGTFWLGQGQRWLGSLGLLEGWMLGQETLQDTTNSGVHSKSSLSKPSQQVCPKATVSAAWGPTRGVQRGIRALGHPGDFQGTAAPRFVRQSSAGLAGGSCLRLTETR